MLDIMSLFSMFGGKNGFVQKFQQFSQQYSNQDASVPEQQVMQLLNSGKMSQEQFNAYSQIANQLTGRRSIF